MVKEHEETHVKEQLRKGLRSVTEEIITLHIKKHWNVTLISHWLVNLLNL